MTTQQQQENIAICNHSSNNAGYVIFSVMLGNDTMVDMLAHEAARDYLINKGISLKELEGSYKGNKELSFIVSQDHMEDVQALAKYHNQESIMLLKSHKHGLYKASLHYLKELLHEDIGYLRQVTKEIALQQDCYSYDKTQDAYFICTESDDTSLSLKGTLTTIDTLNKKGLKDNEKDI